MKIVVTGAAGFIGSSLAERLVTLGHEVVGIDCFTDYYPRSIKEQNLKRLWESSRFTLFEDDLLRINLPELLQDTEIVFHQAAQAGVRASWGGTFSIYTDNNIRATQVLLEAAKDSAGALKKIVYASSSSVYGSAEALPTSEKVLPRPVSPYGVSKLAAEHLMVLYSSEFGVPTASLRYFTVYGPRQRPDMAFHRLLRCGLTGEEFTMFGDGEQTRDFTFIDDIVDANLAAAFSQTPGLVCNVGGGNRVSMNQVITSCENIIGRRIRINRVARAKGDAAHTGADTSLAKAELGYSPKVSLEHGLEQEARWIDEMLRAKVL
jgi:UDP-glucose 4-epimerase